MDNISFTEWSERWDESDEMGSEEYVGEQLHPDVILVMSDLFFPKFVERDGLVFFADQFTDEVYQSLLDRHPSEPRLIQDGINRIHLLDIFSHQGPQTDASVLEQAGEVLQKVWEQHVHHSFPHRKFNVNLDVSESEYGPVLTFFQIDS